METTYEKDFYCIIVQNPVGFFHYTACPGSQRWVFGVFSCISLTQTKMEKLLSKFLLKAWKALRPNFLTLLS